MEQIDYKLLFRWFVGLPMNAEVWHPTVFTKNRDRLLEADVAREFLMALVALLQVKRLMSNEHFTVDGTLIDAWASMKSFRPKDGSGEPPAPGRNGERDFKNEKRSNETHASSTDPDARSFGFRYRKFQRDFLLRNRQPRVFCGTAGTVPALGIRFAKNLPRESGSALPSQAVA